MRAACKVAGGSRHFCTNVPGCLFLCGRQGRAVEAAVGILLNGRLPFVDLRLPGLIHNEHLQPVFHIGIAGIRVQVQRKDLDARKLLLQPLSDAAAADVVRQAPEG